MSHTYLTNEDRLYQAKDANLLHLHSIKEENESPSSENISSPHKDLLKSQSAQSRDLFLIKRNSSKGKFHLIEEQPSFLIFQESSVADEFDE
jgi:hypothetical protein